MNCERNPKVKEMATVSSIKLAQAIKYCELCQEEFIKWRCIDCDRCLCEKCKTIHKRVPVTAQHQIVSIGTPLQTVSKEIRDMDNILCEDQPKIYAQKKIAIDNIPCEDHPKKMACLFCRSCVSLICPDCVSSSHKKHNFDSIETALDEKQDNLRGIHEKIGDNLKCCESKTSEIQYMMDKYSAIFDGSLAKIKQNKQELIDAIIKPSEELQVKVKNDRLEVNSILSKIKGDVDNTKKALEDQREEIDSVLTSYQGGVIFKAAMNMKDLKFDSLPNQIERFVPKSNSTKKIKELFGSFQKKSIPLTRVPPAMDFEVIRSFSIDLPYIPKVVTLDETSAWIFCSAKEVIKKVIIHDNCMKASQEVSLKVLGIALTLNNDLLLSVFNDSEVKLLKGSGEVVSFVTVAPFLPYGIHVTKNNDVLVGVIEPGNKFTPTDQSKRAVGVYGMDGKQKRVICQDYNNGKRLLTCPSRISTNNNQDILVVDRTSEITGRVVVVNKEGHFRWTYEGHDKINARVQFFPVDIVPTAAGHVIVSDWSSHALHVLSVDGEVLTCNVMRDMGIKHPSGLDIDKEGKLWLGCSAAKNELDSKLHIIKIIS